MGRKPCCEKVGLKRGPWTAEEDQKLVSYITNNGICCWRAIPKLAGLLRCGKSCRLRWTNYLRPDLKRGIFSEEEENVVLDLHATLGNRWSRIAAQLPGRTDNEIKNYWNTRLKKRLRSQGLDPATHLPLDSSKDGEDGDSSDVSGPARRPAKPQKPARQPRGPKPAPQLKLCQSKEGPVILKEVPEIPKVPKVPKSPTRVINPKSDEDSDLSSSLCSSSTVTTKSGGEEDHQASSLARKLTSAPSYPEAELWKCIKPSTTTSSLSTAAFLEEWDSYSLLLNPHPAQANFNTMLPKAGQADMMDFATSQSGHDCGGIYQGTCFSWAMDAEMGQAALESLFAPNVMATTTTTMTMTTPGSFYREMQQPAPAHTPHDLQKLAALLDLI